MGALQKASMNVASIRPTLRLVDMKPRRQEKFLVNIHLKDCQQAVQRFRALGGELDHNMERELGRGFEEVIRYNIGSHGFIAHRQLLETRPLNRQMSTTDVIRLFRVQGRHDPIAFCDWWELMAFSLNHFHRLKDLGDLVAWGTQFQNSMNEPRLVPVIKGRREKPLLTLRSFSRTMWPQDSTFLVKH